MEDLNQMHIFLKKHIYILFLFLTLVGCLPNDSKILPDTITSNPDLNPNPTSPPNSDYDPGPKVGFTNPTSTDCSYYKNLWGFDDTYFCEQWHLINRGIKVKKVPSTSTYAEQGTAGVDIKVEQSLKNYSGEGVRIYVTDDGLFHTHPDIVANYLGGFNNCTGEANSWPATSNDNHGTMVSGIIAAVGGNGIGTVGVAPQSKIFVNNYISCQVGQSQLVKAVKADESYDIWSGSFGIPACAGFAPRTQHQTIYDAYSYGAEKNILYFKANGNDNQAIKCEGFGNTDPANSHYAVASIAAIDHKGSVTNYSTRGANLALAGFAGYGGSSSSPGIVTISQENDYTSIMNGTSAATPMVAGSAALLVDALPGHKWYEYLVLLMRSATQIMESETAVSSINGINYVNYLINDAGYRHSYHYGLGVVDVDAAIDLGKKINLKLPALESYKEKFSNLPTSSTNAQNFSGVTCAEKSIEVDRSFQVFSIEASLSVTIASVKDVMIFLTTPKGKTAQISRTSKIPGSNLTHDQYFKSMQGFAMDSKGTWKIKVCGVSSGVFNSAKMNFYGFDGFPIPARKN
jgi:hypothetical protein